MANIKSQIKRIKTNEKARLRNKSVKSELKTYVRRVREPSRPVTRTPRSSTSRPPPASWTRPSPKGVIHKNQAANRKSKLAKRVASL